MVHHQKSLLVWAFPRGLSTGWFPGGDDESSGQEILSLVNVRTTRVEYDVIRCNAFGIAIKAFGSVNEPRCSMIDERETRLTTSHHRLHRSSDDPLSIAFRELGFYEPLSRGCHARQNGRELFLMRSEVISRPIKRDHCVNPNRATFPRDDHQQLEAEGMIFTRVLMTVISVSIVANPIYRVNYATTASSVSLLLFLNSSLFNFLFRLSLDHGYYIWRLFPTPTWICDTSSAR